MKFGNYDIDIVENGQFALDGGAMFGVVPKPLWSKFYDQGDEKNRIPLSARGLLIRGQGKNILVDVGNGIKMPEKLQKIYSIDQEKSNISANLSRFGLKSADITDVILTHLHFDHCGGSTHFEKDRAVPTFPNAKYHIQKDQFEWAKSPTAKDRASYMPENYMPLESDGLLEKLDGPGSFNDDISLIIAHGHTRALQMVLVDGQEDGKLLFCSDLAPTSAHVPTAFVMGYDNEPLIGQKEKETYFGMAYEENWTVVFQHDAFIQASKIKSGEKGFSAGENIKITD